MTRNELDKDLNKIDSMIDVLRVLTETTKCLCADIRTDGFRELNIKELKMLLELKTVLSKFTGESDDYLNQLNYTPITVSYIE